MAAAECTCDGQWTCCWCTGCPGCAECKPDDDLYHEPTEDLYREVEPHGWED
jgi:hypothetical protein